jgi:hypothetical protein
VESAANQGSPGLELAAKGLCKSPVVSVAALFILKLFAGCG